MPSLYAYAKEHHLTVTGHPMELCHIDSYETNRESEYVIELELPVSSHPLQNSNHFIPIVQYKSANYRIIHFS